MPTAAEIDAAEHAYMLELGKRMRRARKRLKWSMAEVQERTGGEFTASSIGMYERAERVISAPRLHRLAQWYGTTPTDLLLDEVAPDPSPYIDHGTVTTFPDGSFTFTPGKADAA